VSAVNSTTLNTQQLHKHSKNIVQQKHLCLLNITSKTHINDDILSGINYKLCQHQQMHCSIYCVYYCYSAATCFDTSTIFRELTPVLLKHMSCLACLEIPNKQDITYDDRIHFRSKRNRCL